MPTDPNYDTAGRERPAYSAFGDEYRGFDAREPEPQKRGWLILLLAVGVIFVFGAVVFNAYRTGTKERGETTIIPAGSSDFKRRPEPAIPARDTDNERDRLFEPGDANGNDGVIQASTGPSGAAAQQVAGEPTDIRPGSVPRTEAPGRVNSQSASRQPLGPSQPAVTSPSQRQTAPAPAPRPEPTLFTSAFDPGGQYLVQLSALRNVAAAQTVWSQMVEAHPELFAGAVMDIQRADLGAKGIFYRVRAAAFATRTEAVDFCDKLKARGEACIVAARS